MKADNQAMQVDWNSDPCVCGMPIWGEGCDPKTGRRFYSHIADGMGQHADGTWVEPQQQLDKFSKVAAPVTQGETEPCLVCGKGPLKALSDGTVACQLCQANYQPTPKAAAQAESGEAKRKPRWDGLEGHIRLAEQKIDQHLQGECGPRLGVALSELRSALLLIEAQSAPAPTGDQALPPLDEPEEVRVYHLVKALRSEWEQMQPGVDTCYTFEGQLGLEILQLREALSSRQIACEEARAQGIREALEAVRGETSASPAYNRLSRIRKAVEALLQPSHIGGA